MADARPTLFIGAAIYASATKAVQPPDDRTYSAEVTSLSEQSPASSQCAPSGRIRPIHALEHCNILFSKCQELFRKNHKFSHVFSLITENTIVGAIHELPAPISSVNALFYCLLSSTMYAKINTQAKLNLVTGRKLYVSHSWRSTMYHFCRSFGFCNIGKSVKLA